MRVDGVVGVGAASVVGDFKFRVDGRGRVVLNVLGVCGYGGWKVGVVCVGVCCVVCEWWCFWR